MEHEFVTKVLNECLKSGFDYVSIIHSDEIHSNIGFSNTSEINEHISISSVYICAILETNVSRVLIWERGYCLVPS